MTAYVFGPVPSRRLGRSLGVDLVPFKTCTYDCIYCQLGPTTCRTVERKAWAPLDEVLEQVRGALSAEPDYVTLSGSGEPTLHVHLGDLIAGIKGLTDVPVAVLTNGSLLWRPEVRRALVEADLVVPSLDAGDEAAFQRVNRPHPSLRFEQVVEGLAAFRKEYQGRYWLEVFLVDGITTTEDQVRKMADIARRIDPDRVQLNTVTRPPSDADARAVSKERMEELAALFGRRAEVIADWDATRRRPEFAARREDVLEMLRRRPCTVEDIAAGLGLHRNEVVKYVQELTDENRLDAKRVGHLTYYKAR